MTAVPSTGPGSNGETGAVELPIEQATVEEFSDAIRGSDQDWHDFSGSCGGCGDPKCHEGRCPTSLCNVCPSRIAEGWFDTGMRTAR